MVDEQLKTILSWLGGNWGWVIAVFCLFFEITPIKLHPITAALSWVGKKLTGDIRKDIADLREDVDQQRMASIRSLVLDFSNSCINGRRHTKEEFDHVIEENKTYKKLVARYDIENEVYKEAYEYLLRVYRKRLDKRDFLTAPKSDQDEEQISCMDPKFWQ